MNQIQIWPNHHIVDTVQQLGDAGEVEENVQIQLNVLDDCKNQIIAVQRQGNEELQRG